MAGGSDDRVTVSRFGVADLGVGVGYRVPHYGHVVDTLPAMDWFEVLSENFMVDGGSPLHHLDRLAAAYRLVPHGVSLSLGSAPDPDHHRRLMALLDRLQPPWFSDHLCWTGAGAVRVHDLLPVPFVPEMADHIVDRLRRVQDDSGRLFAVENVSSYLQYKASRVPEWEFLADVVERADCAVLLDVNNVYVSACNHGLDPYRYLDAIPVDRVVQVHLAGHSVLPTHRVDTHDHPVCDEVWELYRYAIARIGPVSTLIEWDGNIPSFERLQAEAEAARAHRDAALADRAAMQRRRGQVRALPPEPHAPA